jgi:type I restriction enzyme M protein
MALAEPADVARNEEDVRQRTLKELRRLGWREEQILWKPEWRVPDTPHDLTKRERGQSYATCGSCDIVLFDAKGVGEWEGLRVIFELKAPDIDAGRAQLMRYLSNEPMAKLGYWTNGSHSLAIYKTLDGNWLEIENAPLPRPGDDLSKPAEAPLTWNTMSVPTDAELTGAFKRLLDFVVVTDTRATRRDVQLREMVHVVLVKLNSDNNALMDPDQPVTFDLRGDDATRVETTAEHVRSDFRDLYAQRRDTIFARDDRDELQLDDSTIYQVVVELARFRLLFVDAEVVAKAFQIFRTHAMKSGEGQFLTPQRVIRPAVMAMDIQQGDKLIDPACGTGGFLLEAIRQMSARFQEIHHERRDLAGQLLTKWANERIYGVDLDDIGVKLTRMLMLAVGDGSTHTLIGDSVNQYRWRENYPNLIAPLADEQYTAVITNPPFGETLKMKAADARRNGYTIARAAAMKGENDYADLEIGLIFLERCFRLARIGGRVGIVLPETYFFSHQYRWLPGWLKGRLELRGMLNIPMEAFQEWCRAKTNFYIFEKVGRGLDGEPAEKPEEQDTSEPAGDDGGHETEEAKQ